MSKSNSFTQPSINTTYSSTHCRSNPITSAVIQEQKLVDKNITAPSLQSFATAATTTTTTGGSGGPSRMYSAKAGNLYRFNPLSVKTTDTLLKLNRESKHEELMRLQKLKKNARTLAHEARMKAQAEGKAIRKANHQWRMFLQSQP